MVMKFKIKDEDNRVYEVEEVEDEKVEEETEVVEDTDKQELSADEISALKALAAAAPQLMKLIEVEKKEHEAVEDEDVEEDKEEDIDEDIEEEKVVDTMKGHDSKKSFGSIEKTKIDDSLVDEQTEIADAWAKRYGGK